MAKRFDGVAIALKKSFLREPRASEEEDHLKTWGRGGVLKFSIVAGGGLCQKKVRCETRYYVEILQPFMPVSKVVGFEKKSKAYNTYSKPQAADH